MTAESNIDVMRNRRTGFSFINKFGRNRTTVAGHAIWAVGGAYVEPTAPNFLSVVSTNAADSANGLGTRKVALLGIDENYNQIVELVTTNGLTPVLSTNKFWFLNVAHGPVAGTINGTVGNITISMVGLAQPLGVLLPGYGQTQSALFMVPVGFRAFMNSFHVTARPNSNSSKWIDIGLYKREFGEPFRVQNECLFNAADGIYQDKAFDAPLPYGPRSTLVWKVVDQDGAHDVTIDFDIWLVRDGSP